MFECIPFKLKSHLTEMLCNHSTQFQAHLGKVPCYRQSQPSSLSWSHGWGSTAFCISASLYCRSGLYGIFGSGDVVSHRASLMHQSEGFKSEVTLSYLRCAYAWIQPFSALELWLALEYCTAAPLFKSQQALEQMDSVPIMSLESVWSQWTLGQVITFPNHSFPSKVLKFFLQ